MPPSTILWLALLVVLALLFVVTLRRMSALVARTRDLERYQRAVEAIDRRFAAAVQPLVRGLDETRRHAGDPDALSERLTETQGVLAALQVEIRALAAPPPLVGTVAPLAGDIDRAVRAASLVEHGLGALARSSLGRDLEAQTSLKRGALNLRHAQEAFGLRAHEVASLRPVDIAPGATHRSSVPAQIGVYGPADGEDLDGRFDPRM
jgi:hypothetical protein